MMSKMNLIKVSLVLYHIYIHLKVFFSKFLHEQRRSFLSMNLQICAKIHLVSMIFRAQYERIVNCYFFINAKLSFVTISFQNMQSYNPMRMFSSSLKLVDPKEPGACHYSAEKSTIW